MSSVRDPFNEGREAANARRRRSLAIALMCVLFAALVFTITAVRLYQNMSGSAAPAAGAAR